MKMTAPRLVARASRSRFFIGLGLLVLMVGFVAIFHSSQQQLDELRQLGLRCEQQQEAISAKMQAVVDQKLRLENSLASERMINEQNRVELHQKAKDEKEQHSKSTMEANIRYASLQQHYNLMKSQLDDLTEECSKTKKKQLEEVNSLRLQVSELQGKVALHQKESTSNVEHLKAQLRQVKLEKSTLETNFNQQMAYKDKTIEKLKEHNEKMEKENSQYIELCKIPPEKMPHHFKASEVFGELPPGIPNTGPLRNFAEQISVSEDLYKIPVVLRNRTNNSGVSHSGLAPVFAAIEQDQESRGVIAKPFETNENPKKPSPAAAVIDGGVINSVENFQIIPKPMPVVSNVEPDAKKQSPQANNVLQEPVLVKTSTSISSINKKTSEKSSNLQVPILAAPTVGFPDGNKSTSTTTPNNILAKKTRSKALPVGVVPFPENMEDLMKPDENNSENAINNRYLNVASLQTANGYGEKRSRNDKDLNFINGNVDIENGAHEVNDNDFNLGGGVNNNQLHQPNVKDANPNGENVNAAEEDTNLYDQKLFANPLIQQQAQHGDYNDLHHHMSGKREGVVGKVGIGEKLINEIVRDHGKEGDNYPNEMEEDLHLDGPQEAEEDGGDVGDYDDPAAMKQGHAERN
ncbi:calponin homology domain-containing protein DDB_G0272472-like isoform X1 [Malaya genurostris]|uniref:calponin homology domain-containing protein DDB_G0272472-like isoform X1 n=1 Tax=Malaya genurostris TaxID=325434 RepID=UPI0026F3FDDE|nr:calponin homology domain-containing protein DDB_G0272472-like isoform X1 [Malaya genurostris]